MLHENKLFEDKDATSVLVSTLKTCNGMSRHYVSSVSSAWCYSGELFQWSKYTGKYDFSINKSPLIFVYQNELQTLLSHKPDFVVFNQ